MTTQEDIRRRVTDQVVNALRAGSRPWIRPWCGSENVGLPTNVASGNRYSGVNVLTLQIVSLARGYTSKYWATFNQLRDLGFQVKKRPSDVRPGEWGTRIIFCKPITKTKKDRNGEDHEERFLVMREFIVFNIEQATGPGVEEFLARPRTSNGFIDFKPAEDVVAATGADIRHGGDWAVYRSDDDFIQLPPKEAFLKAHEYYSTALHELCHWSGHETRLARLSKLARFGNASYAMEELVAEMGSAFLQAELGIPQSEDLSNVAAYLANWLEVLERDHSAIFTASTAASRAADFILGFSKPQTETIQQEVAASGTA